MLFLSWCQVFSSSQLEVKSLLIMNTSLLLLIPFKYLQILAYSTSVSLASSGLLQTGTFYLRARHSMDVLQGIISISLLGNKQFLRYQLHFSPLLIIPWPNQSQSNSVWLFALTLESTILQIQLRVFSSSECVPLPLFLCNCHVMLNFNQYWEIPLQFPLVTKHTQDYFTNCCYILYPLHLLALGSSLETWAIRYLICPCVPFFSPILSHSIGKERAVKMSRC